LCCRPRGRLHDLRHGHGTALAENGVDPATISERLGHASVQFTFDTYVKPSAARQARAVDELEGRVFRKDSPTI